MFFSCDKESLQQAVQVVQRGVSAKAALPVLTGILLQAEENSVTLRTTDLELFIQISIPAEVEKSGSAVVSARYFTDLVRRLPAGKISFSQDNQLLVLRYGDSELNLSTWPAEDFPGPPAFTVQHELFLPAPLVRNMIRKTAFAAAHDENRPLFTACYLDFNDDLMSMVATDTHRLAWKKTRLDAAAGYPSSLIPVRVFLELGRFLDNETDDLKIGLAGTYILFEISDIQIISRLVEGKYPNYRQVIPEQFQTTVTAPRQELIDAVERAAVIVSGRDGTSVIKLKIKDETLTLTSRAAEVGSIKEQIPVNAAGVEEEIAFNSRYLLEGLKAIETDTVLFKLNGPRSAGVIAAENDEDYIYLILPILTQD
jgi:DNA polymerase-3 subunit beta